MFRNTYSEEEGVAQEMTDQLDPIPSPGSDSSGYNEAWMNSEVFAHPGDSGLPDLDAILGPGTIQESDPNMTESDPNMTESDPNLIESPRTVQGSDPNMTEPDPNMTESPGTVQGSDPNVIESPLAIQGSHPNVIEALRTLQGTDLDDFLDNTLGLNDPALEESINSLMREELPFAQDPSEQVPDYNAHSGDVPTSSNPNEQEGNVNDSSTAENLRTGEGIDYEYKGPLLLHSEGKLFLILGLKDRKRNQESEMLGFIRAEGAEGRLHVAQGRKFVFNDLTAIVRSRMTGPRGMKKEDLLPYGYYCLRESRPTCVMKGTMLKEDMTWLRAAVAAAVEGHDNSEAVKHVLEDQHLDLKICELAQRRRDEFPPKHYRCTDEWVEFTP